VDEPAGGVGVWVVEGWDVGKGGGDEFEHLGEVHFVIFWGIHDCMSE